MILVPLFGEKREGCAVYGVDFAFWMIGFVDFLDVDVDLIVVMYLPDKEELFLSFRLFRVRLYRVHAHESDCWLHKSPLLNSEAGSDGIGIAAIPGSSLQCTLFWVHCKCRFS